MLLRDRWEVADRIRCGCPSRPPRQARSPPRGVFARYVFELEIEKTARPAEEELRVRSRLPAMSFVLAFPDFFTDLARVVRICWRLFWARSCESPSVKANAKITVSNRDGIIRI